MLFSFRVRTSSTCSVCFQIPFPFHFQFFLVFLFIFFFWRPPREISGSTYTKGEHIEEDVEVFKDMFNEFSEQDRHSRDWYHFSINQNMHYILKLLFWLMEKRYQSLEYLSYSLNALKKSLKTSTSSSMRSSWVYVLSQISLGGLHKKKINKQEKTENEKGKGFGNTWNMCSSFHPEN